MSTPDCLLDLLRLLASELGLTISTDIVYHPLDIPSEMFPGYVCCCCGIKARGITPATDGYLFIAISQPPTLSMMIGIAGVVKHINQHLSFQAAFLSNQRR